MEAGRYPFSIRLTGVMIKEKKKLFMISVLWSNQDEVVVYRSFGEFKKMHRQLKKTHPPTNKLKKSDRILPRFRDKTMKQSSPKKDPKKSLVYIKFLQAYCEELLNCDPQVSQSAEVNKFFSPKDQDLKTDFSKNSIIIMPPDDEIRGEGGHSGPGNVTQPFVTETYRCVAPFEVKDTKNKPFKVALDEKLDVLIKDKAGWWLVENEDKQMAWFPAPYLGRLDDDEDDDEMDGTPERGALYTAVKGYRATKSDEITVNIGAVVEVLQKSENGWWLVRYSGKVGYIPTIYLKAHNHPHARLSPHHSRSPSPSAFLAPPSNLQQQSQLSLSQGNLLQSPPIRSSSPFQLQPDSRIRSRSLNVLSEPQPRAALRPPPSPPSPPSPRSPRLPPSPRSPRPPHPPPSPPSPSSPSSPTPAPRAAAARPNIPAASPTYVASRPAAAQQVPLPTIMVEMDDGEVELEEVGEASGRMIRADSEGSFMSDSTDFSFSDDFSSSSASSSLNLSGNDDRSMFSRTPPPPSAGTHLSPTSGLEGRLMPSISDPNLYQGPRSPRVPPRPRTQDIFNRCGTITRKNAAKSLTPTEMEITSR